MTPEQTVQKDIIAYLKLKPVFTWRNNTGYRGGVHFGMTGSADIIGLHQDFGTFIAIEVKAPGGKPTDKQIEFLSFVHQCGGLAGVARSISDVDLILDGHLLL